MAGQAQVAAAYAAMAARLDFNAFESMFRAFEDRREAVAAYDERRLEPGGETDPVEQEAAFTAARLTTGQRDRLAGLPVGHARRPVFSWYGDMDLASHFWQLAQWRSMRASIVLHPPLDPADFATRKALAQAAWEAVAQGAADLRQNRPLTVPVHSASATPQPERATASKAGMKAA